MKPFVDDGGLHLRSQDLPPAYVVNGGFYLIAPEDLRSSGTFHTGNFVPLVVEDPVESIDLDTEWDWEMAEAIVGARSASMQRVNRAGAGRQWGAGK